MKGRPQSSTTATTAPLSASDVSHPHLFQGEESPYTASSRHTQSSSKTYHDLVWPPTLEDALLEALDEWHAMEARPSTSKDHARYFMLHRFLADRIRGKTGVECTEEQVGLRLEQFQDSYHVFQGVLNDRRQSGSPAPRMANDHFRNRGSYADPIYSFGEQRSPGGNASSTTEGLAVFGRCANVELNNSHITVCGGAYSHSASHHSAWFSAPPPPPTTSSKRVRLKSSAKPPKVRRGGRDSTSKSVRFRNWGPERGPRTQGTSFLQRVKRKILSLSTTTSQMKYKVGPEMRLSSKSERRFLVRSSPSRYHHRDRQGTRKGKQEAERTQGTGWDDVKAAKTLKTERA